MLKPFLTATFFFTLYWLDTPPDAALITELQAA